jgi:hypothetical protein
MQHTTFVVISLVVPRHLPKTWAKSQEIIEHLVNFWRIFLEKYYLTWTKISPKLLREVFADEIPWVMETSPNPVPLGSLESYHV